MRCHFLFSIARMLGVAASLSCAAPDKVAGPLPGGSGVSIPAAGPLSSQVPTAGPADGEGAVAGRMSFEWAAGSMSVPSPSGSTIPEASASVPAAATAATAAGRLLWQKPSTQQRSIWVLDGTWSPSFVTLQQVPTPWLIVGTGDFDADGHADIVWENLSANQRSIWYLNGNKYEGRHAILPSVPAGWSISAVGDFNADTKPDLVWSHTSGQRSIWYMKGANGAVVSHYGILPTVPAAWKIVGAGDFNADNKTDLVWENLGEVSGKQHSIWIMNGGTYTGQYKLLAAVPAGWSLAAVGDLTADAKPDLVWQKSNGERSVWVMNGSVASSYAILPTVSDTQWDIAAVLPPHLGKWTSNAPIPTNRYYAASGGIGGVFYVTGGNSTAAGGITGITEAYDPATNSWTVKASMPTPRESSASAVVGGVLYVIGGRQQPPPFNPMLPPPVTNATAIVEAYNPATDTWVTKAPMPATRFAAVAGVVNGIIYVAGGYTMEWAYASSVYAYDPNTNVWTEKAAIPSPLAYSAGAVANGVFYVAGGFGYSGVYNTLQAYNPVTNTWTTKAPMPTERGYGAAGSINGVIYVVGGGNVTGDLAKVEAYFPVTNTWKKRAPMPTGRFGAVAGVVNGALYVAGSNVNHSSYAPVLAFFP